MFWMPSASSAMRMQTAFCSNQQSTSESGRSLTPHWNASAQRQRDLNGAVCVVALAHIEDAGQARHGAEIQVVQAEFAAGQRQDHGVGRGELGELGVVAAGRPGAVTAAHQEEWRICPLFTAATISLAWESTALRAKPVTTLRPPLMPGMAVSSGSPPVPVLWQ